MGRTASSIELSIEDRKYLESQNARAHHSGTNSRTCKNLNPQRQMEKPIG